MMKREMIKLLLSHNVITEEEAKKLDLINDESIENAIKELGFGKTEHITKEKICEKLETEDLAKEILCFRKVFSTNSIAKFLANHDAEEGTVLISEIQTNARGRLGKKWEAPDGGVWMSMILRPQVPPARIGLITLATGVAIAKAIRSLGVDAKIKWPNDVLIHGNKISGVLTEVNATFNEIDWVVVGIGIDSNLKLEDFSEDIRIGTTTLTEELPSKVDENELIAIFLNEFEKVYQLYKDGEIETILKDWRDLSDTIGKYVNITQTGGKITQGYVIGINNEGSLIIERQDGTLEKIISGELRTVE
jgi:BirA family biotin operon repressor/biotin-[acetyl-CoA-carboxylase] ligase